MQTKRQVKRRSGGSAALTVLNVILCLILAFLTIINITVIVKSFLHPEDPPGVFGVYPMVVDSNVMEGPNEDSIHRGDMVFVQATKTEKLKMGDVVVYYSESGALLLGRINGKAGDAFMVQGDSVAVPYSERLTADNVLGRIAFQLPMFGRVSSFATSQWGFLTLVVLPMVVMVCLIIVELVETRRRKKKKKRLSEATAGSADPTAKKKGVLKSLLLASLAAVAFGVAKSRSASRLDDDDD